MSNEVNISVVSTASADPNVEWFIWRAGIQPQKARFFYCCIVRWSYHTRRAAWADRFRNHSGLEYRMGISSGRYNPPVECQCKECRQ